MNEMRNAPPGTAAPQYNTGPADHVQQIGMEAAPIRKTKQFYVKHTSQFDDQLYEGQFTCRKLSIKDLAQIGVRKVQLNGGYHHDPDRPGVGIDEQTDWIHNMMAHLEIALVQAPSWWSLDETYDGDLLAVVFKEIADFESTFFRPSLRPANVSTGGGQSNGGGTSEETRTVGHVEAVGRGEVQTALEP